MSSPATSQRPDTETMRATFALMVAKAARNQLGLTLEEAVHLVIQGYAFLDGKPVVPTGATP